MEGIEPYDFSEIKDFALEYMSGFLAEKWDVDEIKALPYMKTRAENFLENSLRQSGQKYASFTMKSKNIAVNDVSAAYSMLPVYILTNLYKGKPHTFILNGQTGKIYGETPYDYLKMVLFFIFLFISTLIVSIITGGLINVLS
ncbi:MAG: hypothetical protein PF637_05215 [Spirochaetes bacterium]|jgi:hypothetical protein|nr:hypothetical protein [Spirochaetota bacterium]